MSTATVIQPVVFRPRTELEKKLWFLVEHHGWAGPEVQALASYNVRAEVQRLIRGIGDARIAYHVDDDRVLLPRQGMVLGYRPEPDTMSMGTYYLFIHEDQKKSEGMQGHDLLRKFDGMQTVDASVICHFLRYPETIPLMFLEFDRIFFWGTEFQNKEGTATCVACLKKEGQSGKNSWTRSWEWLGFSFGMRDAALMFRPNQ